MCRFGFVVFVDNIRSVDELYVTSCNKFELHGHKWHYVLKLGYGSQFGPFSVLFKLNTHRFPEQTQTISTDLTTCMTICLTICILTKFNYMYFYKYNFGTKTFTKV